MLITKDIKSFNIYIKYIKCKQINKMYIKNEIQLLKATTEKYTGSD